ncbi:MAG: amidohydrolase family protein, partial [Clostridia bacterium]|nr:amidohydrolase family protein [Clostridia bacterium]
KFLFGTDFPMWDHEKELERFLSLSLTNEENQMILYDNFIKLFDS